MPKTFIDNMSSAGASDTLCISIDVGGASLGNNQLCLSETVDSIQYFSLKYCPSEDKTEVMMLTDDDDYELHGDSDESEYELQDVLELLHFLHLEEKNLTADTLR